MLFQNLIFLNYDNINEFFWQCPSIVKSLVSVVDIFILVTKVLSLCSKYNLFFSCMKTTRKYLLPVGHMVYCNKVNIVTDNIETDEFALPKKKIAGQIFLTSVFYFCFIKCLFLFHFSWFETGSHLFHLASDFLYNYVYPWILDSPISAS